LLLEAALLDGLRVGRRRAAGFGRENCAVKLGARIKASLCGASKSCGGIGGIGSSVELSVMDGVSTQARKMLKNMNTEGALNNNTIKKNHQRKSQSYEMWRFRLILTS
jgi:hypothetical protein